MLFLLLLLKSSLLRTTRFFSLFLFFRSSILYCLSLENPIDMNGVMIILSSTNYVEMTEHGAIYALEFKHWFSKGFIGFFAE